MTLEECCECSRPTGMGGADDDSLYCPFCDEGPFCPDCWGEHMDACDGGEE